jgi:hypothetical protein
MMMATWEDWLRLIAWLGIVTTLCLLMIIAAWPAYGGEVTMCTSEPGGAEWSYRTNVDGRPDKCWYRGPRMKSRTELKWPVKVEVDAKPAYTEMVLPVRAQEEFEDRWQGLRNRENLLEPTPVEQWRLW